VTATYTIGMGFAHTTGAANQLLFTTPSTDKYILRDVVAVNESAASAQLIVYVQSGSVTYRVFQDPGVPAGTSRHLELRQVLPPDSLVYANTSQASSFALTGYHLAG